MDERAKLQASPHPGEAPSSAPPAKQPYEPPRILATENVRDLVAGGVGSKRDAVSRVAKG